jgi:2'-5' RNA ligase
VDGITSGDGGSTVTIGVSVAVPDPYGARIQDARAGYGDPLARAVPTHVTLLPPTEVPRDQLGAIELQLSASAARHRPFRVLLHGSGSFRPVSPVVYVRLEAGVRECRMLEAAVRSGLLARELAFPYHPHVTVAQALDEPVLDRAQRDFRDYRAEFEVPGFSLYLFGPDGVWRPELHLGFGSADG